MHKNRQNFTKKHLPQNRKFQIIEKKILTYVENERALRKLYTWIKLFSSLLRRYRPSGGMPLLFKAITLLSAKYKKKDPLQFFINAVKEVTPIYGLNTYTHKNRLYQVPTLISGKKSNFLALTWIMSAVAKMNGDISDRLARIFIDITTQDHNLPRKLLREHNELVKANIKNAKYHFGKRKKRVKKNSAGA